jgi:hypothetical protein
MMVLRRLFIDRFLYVPLRVQLHALRLRCSVPLSMANLREPLYSPNVGEDEFSEDEMRRPTPCAVPFGSAKANGLLRPERRIGPHGW